MKSQFKTIVVPTDFSASAEDAVRAAAELARVENAVLCIVHVHQASRFLFAESYVAPTAQQQAEAIQACDAQLDEAATLARGTGAPNIETQLLCGDPVQEIVTFARRRACDLIVMGTLGRTGLRHALLGSVAEEVIRRADCPVMAVRHRVQKASLKQARV